MGAQAGPREMSEEMIAKIAALRRYPTKSLAPEDLLSCAVESDGLEGDRRQSLIVTSEHARRSKPYRGKEHDELHYATSGEEAMALARDRGVETTIARGARFFDDGSVSLMTDRWLAQLAAHLGYDPGFERFRPNIFAEAFDACPEHEEALVGRRLGIGDCLFDVVATIKRCVAVTYDQNGGPHDPHLLRVLARERDNVMGIYCDVVKTGIIHRDDHIRLIPA